MLLFIDHHRRVERLTAEAGANAHRNDEEIQDDCSLCDGFLL
jgi:hypothetical protein